MSKTGLAGIILTFTFAAVTSSAASITANLLSFGSDPASVTITLDDAATPGFLTISGASGPDPIADLRGLFLEVDANLSGFNLITDVIDPAGIITDRAFNTTSLPGGNNVEGEIVNQGFAPDLAFGFGTPGIGSDDINSFTIQLAGLLVQDVQGVAVRATSVGSPGGPREGSDKLFLVVPAPQAIPEPLAVSTLGLGLLALIVLRHARSSLSR